MITQLATLKSRLAIPDADTTTDALLTAAIKAVSARFDKETNRTLARTVAFQQEFDPEDTEILAACYPVESVTRWETKSSESEGWLAQPAPSYLVRSSCILSLRSPFIIYPSSFLLSRLTRYPRRAFGHLQPSPLPVSIPFAAFKLGYVPPGV